MTLKAGLCKGFAGNPNFRFARVRADQVPGNFSARTGRLLVTGLGNTLFSDDGAGIRVARMVKSRLKDPRVEVRELSRGGLDLVEAAAGYPAVLIIDAVKAAGCRPGALYRLSIPVGSKEAGSLVPPAGVHGMDLASALNLFQALGLPYPRHLEIYGIGVKDPETIGERCTPVVEAALEGIAARLARRVKTLIQMLEDWRVCGN